MWKNEQNQADSTQGSDLRRKRTSKPTVGVQFILTESLHGADTRSSDLETYNVRTDGHCLLALAAALFVLSRAYSQGGINKKYSKALIAVTIAHHILTAIGSYGHYKLDTHYNKVCLL